ncbi:ankyrin repeat domain-containing protein [Altererythrobacter gangjinensis]|uniref:Ankyrin repeat domain-containing protein n=2 Tax=Pontixanthobacter gangjinensis TaxID=1028742 RepID=A0A6I4SSC1_9SPHN|nr:ankyrin repeat domain-containing protein [Pontixanthobacter gangjinensis]
MGAAALTAVPAAAQFQSDGYKFLEAVKENEGDIVTEALKEPGSVVVNTRDITTGETALHIVAKRRDTQWVKFLTAYGANPNIADRNGLTPLQIVATLGAVDAAEALIDAGAIIDKTNSSGETPLITAIHRKDVAMARLLLSKGASADRSDNSGRTGRDYIALQTGNSLMLNELKKADEARANAGPTQTYGPQF